MEKIKSVTVVFEDGHAMQWSGVGHIDDVKTLVGTETPDGKRGRDLPVHFITLSLAVKSSGAPGTEAAEAEIGS